MVIFLRYFVVGAKGAGCTALINILLDLGEKVDGCDVEKDFYTQDKLNRIKVLSFDAVKLSKDYFYIIGNAFRNHPLTIDIIKGEYNYAYYPEFIEDYFKMPKIGVAGSHGKTSTTTFLSQLTDCQVNSLIGDGTGVGNKDAQYFIFEACEYQRNFLRYSYDYLVILNIDYDHPDYFKDESDYFDSFKEVVKKTKCLICNYDDLNCNKLQHRHKITFGFAEKADMVIKYISNKLSLFYLNECYTFDVPFTSKGYCYDFAAAFLCSLMISRNTALVCENSKKICLPKRRMNIHYQNNNIYVDDYAHHPSEITNVITEIKGQFPTFHFVVIFQPHTYSRSKAFYEDFKNALALADEVYIMHTFSSIREKKIEEDPSFGYLLYDESVRKVLLSRRNQVIAFLGAGDIGEELTFYL